MTKNFNQFKDGSCSEDYKKISTVHTACLPPLVNVIKKGVSKAEKNLIVDMHNEWRRKVDVPAAAMLKMVYSSLLFFLKSIYLRYLYFSNSNLVLG